MIRVLTRLVCIIIDMYFNVYYNEYYNVYHREYYNIYNVFREAAPLQ